MAAVIMVLGRENTERNIMDRFSIEKIEIRLPLADPKAALCTGA